MRRGEKKKQQECDGPEARVRHSPVSACKMSSTACVLYGRLEGPLFSFVFLRDVCGEVFFLYQSKITDYQ
jgi:hypothetical protein